MSICIQDVPSGRCSKHVNESRWYPVSDAGVGVSPAFFSSRAMAASLRGDKFLLNSKLHK